MPRRGAPDAAVLGHFDKIGAKPAYRHLMVPVPLGGIAGHHWTTTVDVRKPEAVALVSDLVDEICQAFPGKFVNMDITEIADYGFVQSGTKAEDLPGLMLGYTVKLRDMLARHHMQLIVGQCALDNTGHMNGIGPALDKLPKDIVVGSYYTADFNRSWDKDFPRLQQKGIGLFAQPWIESHVRIMPTVGYAMGFSDRTVSRSLPYGVMGSVTADWGDNGHYHLPGTTWYPFLYHCASAWTGATLDRDYFNRAFGRLLFGGKDDAVARAILLVGDINRQTIKIKNAAGRVVHTRASGHNLGFDYYFAFFANPFSDGKILQLADPGQQGRDMLRPAKMRSPCLKPPARAETATSMSPTNCFSPPRTTERWAETCDARALPRPAGAAEPGLPRSLSSWSEPTSPSVRSSSGYGWQAARTPAVSRVTSSVTITPLPRARRRRRSCATGPALGRE